MDPEGVRAQVTAAAVVQEQIAEAAVAEATDALQVVDAWTDPDQLDSMASRVGGAARTGAQRAAATTDAYLAKVISGMTGRAATLAGVISTSTPLRIGLASWEEEYLRLGAEVRYQRFLGKDADRALLIALQRAGAMIRMDLALARRSQSLATFGVNSAVIGWRRVIHPELSKGGTCGLCVAASGVLYGPREPMPLHDRCKCEPVPVTRTQDPGAAMNARDSVDLEAQPYRIEQNGELGPILVRQGDTFRGPDQVQTAA